MLDDDLILTPEFLDEGELQQASETGIPLSDGTLLVIQSRQIRSRHVCKKSVKLRRADRLRSVVIFDFEAPVAGLWLRLSQGLMARGTAGMSVVISPGQGSPYQVAPELLEREACVTGPLQKLSLSFEHDPCIDALDHFEGLCIGTGKFPGWPEETAISADVPIVLTRPRFVNSGAKGAGRAARSGSAADHPVLEVSSKTLRPVIRSARGR